MQQNTAAFHVLPLVKYPDMEAILFGSYAYGEPGKAMVYDIKEKGIRIE
jgi:hypothetical protein